MYVIEDYIKHGIPVPTLHDSFITLKQHNTTLEIIITDVLIIVSVSVVI